MNRYIGPCLCGALDCVPCRGRSAADAYLAEEAMNDEAERNYVRGWPGVVEFGSDGEPSSVLSGLRRSKHVARRDHADGKVKKGDAYVRVVRYGYEVGGPRWLHASKKVTARASECAA